MHILSILIATFLVFITVSTAYAGQDDDPRIVHIGRVAPNTISVKLYAQKRVPGQNFRYIAEPGDEIASGLDRWITRNGEAIGALIGRDKTMMRTFDSISGSPLNTGVVSNKSSFSLIDINTGQSVQPVMVNRKSKPTDEVRLGPWNHAYPQEHTLYLTFEEDLVPGKQYLLYIWGHSPTIQPYRFLVNDKHLRTESIHVTQLGFHPKDLVKVGYLSLWKGDGGAQDYSNFKSFSIIDESGDTVYEGNIELSLSKEDTESGRGRNYSLVDVYRMDFSRLREPGTYRIVIDGVGSSYPFVINENIWHEAFEVSMKGLLHHRSGIELGPPFTNYIRPRTMVPGEADFHVFQSDAAIILPPNREVGQSEIFDLLSDDEKTVEVTEAWGGYMDAGDWDRRAHHLFATRLLLELYDYHSDYFDQVNLSLPQDEVLNSIPDILDEAVFNLDFYRRLQVGSGGIRGWVESEDHPRYGEVSWNESLSVFVTRPEPFASYEYASTAARFARLVYENDEELSNTYRSSAIKAFHWAEDQLESGKWDSEFYMIRDTRNLAAVELYKLVGDRGYHQVFMETTAFLEPRSELQKWQEWHQRESGAAYVMIDDKRVDKNVHQNAYNALVSEADDRVALSTETGFGWTNDRYAWVGWGQQTAQTLSLTLVRAHRITKDDKYLAAIQRASHFGTGANPVNMSMTTGIGHNWPQNPLHIDTHATGRKAPIGITVYGPLDPIPHGADKDLYWSNNKINEAGGVYPDMRSWPPLEAYWDIFMHPGTNEYTVMQTLGPSSYIWGYLSAYLDN